MSNVALHPNHPGAPPPESAGPASYDAEHAVIGLVLEDSSQFPPLAHLKPEHFAEEVHGRIWGYFGQVNDTGGEVDVFATVEHFRDDGAFHELGGKDFLINLLAAAPDASRGAHYAGLITSTAAKRGLIKVCGQAAVTVMRGDVDPFATIGELRTSLDRLEAESAPEDATMISAPDAARMAYERMRNLAENGRTKGLMTGLRCVDRRLGGLRPGALVVVGGRPGMGKTALARCIAHGAAARNRDINFAFLALEMDPEEMSQRELSALTFDAGEGVQYRDMGTGKITPMDLAAVGRAEANVPTNLIIDDCTSLSVEDVRRKVWSLKRRGRLGAVVIDYLQLMTLPLAHGRNDAALWGTITKQLKQIARQARIAVVLLSQLSRQVENRDDKRPQLSDLRESGAIEQDADAVLYPYSEFYYVSRSRPKSFKDDKAKVDWDTDLENIRRRLDVICAKQRQGPAGMDRQEYYAEFDVIRDSKGGDE